MNTYLAILVTVLVLSQIIRLIQNYFCLTNRGDTYERNEHIYGIWLEIEKAVDKYLEESEGK